MIQTTKVAWPASRQCSLRLSRPVHSYAVEQFETARMEVGHMERRLPLRCVALGDNYTHIISYEDGRLARSAHLSYGLYERVKASNKYKKPVACVAMGRNQGSNSYEVPAEPGEVWFVARDTGVTFIGEACEEELVGHWQDWEGDDFITQVVFAPNNGWFAFTEGGGASWSDLPRSLANELDEQWDEQGGVDCVSVGHNGEWFVKYRSGQYTWLGVHPTLDRLLTEQAGGNVEWVELGPDHTYVALFNNLTAWYGSETLTDDSYSA